MTKRLLGTFFLFASVASAAPLEKPCVDYYAIGPSPCKVEEEEDKAAAASVTLPPPVLEEPKKDTAPQPPQKAAAPEKPPLEKRIDEFMENYDKPPREFVAFNLEPTMENALRWVKAYNDMLNRNRELTRAWMQAEALYKQAESKGIDVASALDYEPSMPEVPDLGIPVDAPGSPDSLPPGVQNPMQRFGPNQLQQQGNPFQVRTAAAQRPGALQSQRPTKNIGGGGEVDITYYFSAECPYCQRFEPGFQEILERYPNRFNVTCVDLTPSGAAQKNINGKVDCAWRPAQPGETKQMGIKSTPSLIVNRGAGKPLERVSGFVQPDRLERFLLR